MFDFLKANSMWLLIAQADAVSKVILGLLFMLSVLSWAVFLGKLIALHGKRKYLRAALTALASKQTPQELAVVAAQYHGSTAGYFIERSITIYESLKARRSGMHAQVHEWESMQRGMEQLFDIILDHEESYLPVLSTTAAVAPLLGLLGTVWGLVHSFVRISELQSADIATVAPGIAEALITTFAGLVVAIPALIMYNYLLVQVRTVENLVVQLADRVGFIVQPQLMQ